MEDDLTQLAQRARDGSSSARRTLLRRLAPVVLSTARRILRNADAEDIAQEAMLTFSRDLASLRDPAAVKAFAVRLTARLAIRARVKRNREWAKRAQLAQEMATGSDRHTDPLAARQTAEELLNHLEVLPEEQSETLLLRYFMGLSLAEVALATEVPVNTVRSRVRLARQTLGRRLIRDQPQAAEPMEPPS